jgi:hypothetical protein
MGPAGLMSPDGSRTPSRGTLHSAFWDNISGDEREGGAVSPVPPRSPAMGAPPASPVPGHAPPERGPKGEKDKSKWGFLKKMSMARIKPEGSPPHSRPSTSSGGAGAGGRPRGATQGAGTLPRIHEPPPHIDVRLSAAMAPLDMSAAELVKKQSREMLKAAAAAAAPSPSLAGASLSPDALRPPGAEAAGLGVGLAPPPTPRSARRRSFLPLDGGPPALTIPIPPPAPFVGGVRISAGGGEESGAASSPEPERAERAETPSPAVPNTAELDARMWREQERAREAYARSLRSVMNYLRDMYDLGLSQGGAPAPTDSLRARRPTVAEAGRTMSEQSMMSMVSGGGTASIISSSSDGSTPSRLRAMTSNGALQSTPPSQRTSTATTDSAGSVEERKFKDDKGKRAMIVREIVEYVGIPLAAVSGACWGPELTLYHRTERTYVKGLQELVDIYIKPASQPVSNLTGPKQETVVPSLERRTVFGGVEALFQIHKASFLPALEQVAAPIFKAGPGLAEADHDGRLSLGVTMAVAETFVSHAAFFKMYSTYIK